VFYRWSQACVMFLRTSLCDGMDRCNFQMYCKDYSSELPESGTRYGINTFVARVNRNRTLWTTVLPYNNWNVCNNGQQLTR